MRQAIYQYGVDWDALAQTLGGDMYYHTDAYALTGNPYYTEDLEFTNGVPVGPLDWFRRRVWIGVKNRPEMIIPVLAVLPDQYSAFIGNAGFDAREIWVDAH